jgi:hypothetical protein
MERLLLVFLPFLVLELIMFFPPSADREWSKMIYSGLPGWITEDEENPVVAGPAMVAIHFYYNGWIMLYRGSYMMGLLWWLTRKDL